MKGTAVMKNIKPLKTATSDGGSIVIESNQKGGFVLTTTRGFKETPQERLDRIHNARRGGKHDSRPRRQRTRAASRKSAILASA